jgi:putative membrane protein
MTAPAPASVLPGEAVVKRTERPHPLTPLIRGWLVLVALAANFLRELFPGGGDRFQARDPSWLLILITAIVVVAALAGLVTWYFTRFVIDDEELRIETGALSRTSRRIPFERLQSVDIIQPLAARVFGLVELRLEVGAGDSAVKLRYLQRRRAVQLRDYLLTRAQGQAMSLAGAGSSAVTSAFTDASAEDELLVRVPPQRLVVGFLLSSEWLTTFALTALGLLVASWFDVIAYALPVLIPLAISTATLVSRRVISMFHFTLAQSPRGLRVTRGLTNLTSQTVPVARIQGVKVSQSLLWRLVGLYRLDVDVLGFGASDSENNESSATTVLLPTATAADLKLALARVLPGLDLDVDRRPSPPRTRWARPFDFWTLRYGWNHQALITEHGLLTHETNIVPHAKTQSVRIEQGPWQRRLGLASVHVDTTKGPVTAVARHLDSADARELALSQLDRARDARAMPSKPQTPVPVGGPEEGILAEFRIDRRALIGSGGETEVFALDPYRVLRVYRAGHESPAATAVPLRQLYGFWSGVDIGVQLPLTYDIGERSGRLYTVDRRFVGQNFATWLSTAPTDARRTALVTYVQAANRLAQLPSPVPGFARLVGVGAPQTYDSLAALLWAMVSGPVSRSRNRLAADGVRVDEVLTRLFAEVGARTVTPALVHGDLCPENAYVSLGPDGQPWVSGIGDFSPHTHHGDPLMDVALGVAWIEMGRYPDARADGAWLTGLAVDRFGPDLAHWIGVYRRFYGLYFSDTFAVEPSTYAWCRTQLGG